VENERLRTRLSGVFDTLLSDNTSAWDLGADGSWRRLKPPKGERARPSQQALMRAAARPRRRPTTKRR
jgi:polyphosphate kinase